MDRDPSKANTIPELSSLAAKAYGNRPVLIDQGISLSFMELDAARVKGARALIASDIGIGDTVGIWAPNIINWIVASLAIQTVGALLVPLNTRLKGSEAAFILNQAETKLLFTVKEFLGIDYQQLISDKEIPTLREIICLDAGDSNGSSWEQFLNRGSTVSIETLEQSEHGVTAESPLDIMFTSGTTGRPKGVVTTHGQTLRTFATWSRTVGLSEKDRYLIINPFFHTFGYKAGWLACLMRGSLILPARSFDISSVIEKIASEKITVLPGPPTIYYSLLESSLRDGRDLSSLRLAVTGAAPVPPELIRKMKAELGFDVVLTAYGLTETCGVVSICREGDSPELISRSSGCAMDGVEIKCVDSRGVPVASDLPGEVWCRGFNVMKGYYNDPESTKEAITSDGWLKTGDIGILGEDGYLKITDRLKDMFIVGGFNCYPAEIESQLCEFPGVSRAAVIGVPDERLGEVPFAFVVADSNTFLDTEEILTWTKENMANYKIPRKIEIVEDLPVNASGKVLKTQLRAIYSDFLG